MSEAPFRVLIPFQTSPRLYGLERAVIDTFDLLHPEIEPLFVISLRNDEVAAELAARNMSVVRYRDTEPWPRFGKPDSLRGMAEMWRAFRIGNQDLARNARSCDALYLPGISYGWLAMRAMRHLQRQGRRVVHQFHEFGAPNARSLRWMNRYITDHVHATAYGRRTAERLNPCIKARRSHVIPLVVRVPDRPSPGPAVAALSGCRNIVFAGQLSRNKGVDILLEAFAALAPRYPDARLHLFGDGPLMRESTPQIRFHGYRKDASAFFHLAYAAVQPSPPSRYQETFGLSAAEAMSAGAPVVCFRSGALPEIVNRGGTVCSEETPAFLADAIAFYLDNPEIRDLHAQYALDQATVLTNAQSTRQAWLTVFQPQ